MYSHTRIVSLVRQGGSGCSTAAGVLFQSCRSFSSSSSVFSDAVCCSQQQPQSTRTTTSSWRLAARAGDGGSGVRRAMTPSSTSCSSSSSIAAALYVSHRAQYMQTPGKRDQEAFLAQYDPLEVLCLSDSCTVSEIDKAHERLAQKYGPGGAFPDEKMAERVRRAHEILKDPASPFYMKAHSSDMDRQRLQFELLPKREKKLLQVHIIFAACLVGGVMLLMINMMLKPMRKGMRAALR